MARGWPKSDTFLTDGGATIYCARCGERRKVELPTPIRKYVKFARAFAELHSLCKAPPDTKLPGGTDER